MCVVNIQCSVPIGISASDRNSAHDSGYELHVHNTMSIFALYAAYYNLAYINSNNVFQYPSNSIYVTS